MDTKIPHYRKRGDADIWLSGVVTFWRFPGSRIDPERLFLH